MKKEIFGTKPALRLEQIANQHSNGMQSVGHHRAMTPGSPFIRNSSSRIGFSELTRGLAWQTPYFALLQGYDFIASSCVQWAWGIEKIRNTTFSTRIAINQRAPDLFPPDPPVADPNAGCKLR